MSAPPTVANRAPDRTPAIKIYKNDSTTKPIQGSAWRYEKVFSHKYPAPWDLRYKEGDEKKLPPEKIKLIPIALDTFSITDPVDTIYSYSLQMRLDVFDSAELPDGMGSLEIKYIAVNEYVFAPHFKGDLKPLHYRDASLIFTNLTGSIDEYPTITSLKSKMKDGLIYNIYIINITNPDAYTLEDVKDLHKKNFATSGFKSDNVSTIEAPKKST